MRASGQQCGKQPTFRLRSKTRQKTLRPYLRNEGGKRLRHPCRQHPKAGTRKNRVGQHRSTTTLFAMTNSFMMEKVLLHIPLFHLERKPPALLNNRSRTTTRHKTLVTNLRRGCILTKCILMRKPFRNWSEMSLVRASGQQCGKQPTFRLRSKTRQKTLRPYLRNEGGKRLRHPCRQHPKAGTRKNRVGQHRSTTTLFAMTNPFMMEKVLLTLLQTCVEGAS